MNMMSKATYGRGAKGIVPIVLLVAIVVALVAAAGTGVYFYKFAKPAAPSGAPAPEAGKTVGDKPTATPFQDVFDSLQVAAPGFEVPSASALPSLEASALNLSSASLPSTGVFRDFTAQTDTSYSYKLDVAVPEVQLDVPIVTTEPTESGTGSSGGSTGGSAGSGSDQGTPSAANCAQFSSIPSGYCSAVGDPNGIALCQACKAAGY